MKGKIVKSLTVDSFWRNNVGSVALKVLVFENDTRYQVLHNGSSDLKRTAVEEQEWIFQTYQEAKKQFDKLYSKGVEF